MTDPYGQPQPPQDPFAAPPPSNPYAPTPPPAPTSPPGPPSAPTYGTPDATPPYGQPAPYGQPQSAPPYGAPQSAPPYGAPQSGPAYGQPPAAPYGQAYGYAAAPQQNSMALVSMILSLVGLLTWITAPVGAILGHIALNQIKQSGEAGEGMAKTGIIVGWIITGLGLLFCCGIFAIPFIATMSA